MIGKALDTAAALRVAYLLVTPIEKTDAYKLGLIDADGKTVRKAKTAEEKKATNPLARMCWNIKRMIGLIPGGKTRIGSLAAAYLLMKEAYENDWTEEMLAEQTILQFNTLCESQEKIDELTEFLMMVSEDAPANATGAATSTDGPAMRGKNGKIQNKPPVVKRAGSEAFGTGPSLAKASI